ncbi:MAG: hypothetical protein K9G62_06400 [Alphaproteobacteria bacterium]|nr:hypothetical protein [Alphaproteobacteria bacterium]
MSENAGTISEFSGNFFEIVFKNGHHNEIYKVNAYGDASLEQKLDPEASQETLNLQMEKAACADRTSRFAGIFETRDQKRISLAFYSACLVEARESALLQMRQHSKGISYKNEEIPSEGVLITECRIKKPNRFP